MKKIFIMGMVLASLGQNAMAGTVILKSDEQAGSDSVFKLGVVAKIKRDLQMLIKNGGFTDSTVNAVVSSQSFAFGHSQSATNDAEDYVIDPLIPMASSALQNHVCGVSLSAPEAKSIQKLLLGSLDKTDSASGASCSVTESVGGVKSVAASFQSKLEIKASGGLTGQYSVALINGVEDDLTAVDAAFAFDSAAVAIDSDLDSIAPINALVIGQGNEAEDLDIGDITYSVGFDLNGPLAKKVSRAGFVHTLLAD